MRTILVAVSLLLVVGFNSTIAQTIHIKDLDRFLCKFQLRDTMPEDASHPNGLPRPDLSRVVEWKFDSLDADGRSWAASHPPRERNCEWMCLDLDKQDGELWVSGTTAGIQKGMYQYYVLWDVEGYGGLNAVLSLWKRIGRDSITFVCAHEGYYGGNLSRSWVQKAAQFPDGSFLVCIYEAFGDDDQSYEKYSFLRGESLCDLKPFYIRAYDQDSRTELKYDFSHFLPGSFYVTETSIFTSRDSSGRNVENPRVVLDSASARVLDLWEIAKDSLGIDSTKIDLSMGKPQPLSAHSSDSIRKEIARIDTQVTAIDSIKGILNQNWKVFCQSDSSAPLVQVKDTSKWPDEIEVTFNVVYDSAGEVVKLNESPFSESGDWGMELTYYFGHDGRLIRFDYYYGSFISECTEIFREERRQYFSANGKPIKRTRSFTDRDHKPIDTVGCYFDEKPDVPVYRTTEEVRKTLGI